MSNTTKKSKAVVAKKIKTKEPEAKESKAFGITAMVCGICALCFAAVFPVAVILALAALVFGIIATVKKMSGRGMAIAGIVTGAVALCCSIVVFFTITLPVANFFDQIKDKITNSITGELDEMNWDDLDWEEFTDKLDEITNKF